MITRAYVVEKGTADSHRNKLKIRMPLLDGVLSDDPTGSTSDENLSWASILCIGGINVNYEVGDTVIVAFEDDDDDYPIVLGHLLKTDDDNTTAKATAVFKKVVVEDSFQAPTDTKIGTIDFYELHDAVEKRGN